MAEKPRQVVPGLGDLPNLIPAADPRALDSYTTPGSLEYGKPATTNPLLQLSDALAKLDPTLQRFVSIEGQKFGEEEYARGEKEFWENREKWNDLIRQGVLPEGASPYYTRGLQRAALKQQAADFYAQVHADFYTTTEGAEARQANDPAVMQKFLNDRRSKFVQEHLKRGDKDLFTPLDMQEVFNPAAEQTYKTMLQTHAAYRVAEREKEYEAVVTANIDGVITRNLAQIQSTDSDEVRQQWIIRAAREADDELYNPDTGAVKNGMLPSKGNQILVDTITTKMMKTGNRAYKEVLDHIKTKKEGAPIGNTQYAQSKILAAEEHITDQRIKLDHLQHWRDGLEMERLSKERTREGWQKEDERWARETAHWKRQDKQEKDEEAVQIAARRIFEGLYRFDTDKKESLRVIDEAIRSVAEFSWKDAEHLRNMVHTATKQRMDYEDDPLTVANLRKDISYNPLGFKYDRLIDAVKDRLLKPSTLLQMVDDLERNKANGDHAYMRQPEFTAMLHKVEKSMANQMGDDEFGEGALRAAEAVGDFRDLAVEWIEKNPQGSISAFRNYMRSQIQDVAERHNAAYGETQRKFRERQEALGGRIRDITGAEVGERELKRKDAEAEQQKKQQAAEEQKQHEQRQREEIERNNQTFKPSGKKTSEGRSILQDENGNIATERTTTVTDERINYGRPTNIPTIYGGKFYSEKEARDIIAKNNGIDPDTGRKLRGYYSINDAVIAARERSDRLGKEYGQTVTKTSEQKKVTVNHLRTLLTEKEKIEIGELKQRVERPGIKQKPATQEQLKDRVMEALKPHFNNSAELAEGVEEFMKVLLPPKKKDK